MMPIVNTAVWLKASHMIFFLSSFVIRPSFNTL
jgi:hypothetical protein